MVVPFRPAVGLRLHLHRAEAPEAGAVARALAGVRGDPGREGWLLPEGISSLAVLFGEGGGGVLRAQGSFDPPAYLAGLSGKGYRLEAGSHSTWIRGGDLEAWLEGALFHGVWGTAPRDLAMVRTFGRPLRVFRLGRARGGLVLGLWVARGSGFFPALAGHLPLPLAEVPHPFRRLGCEVHRRGLEGRTEAWFELRIDGVREEERDGVIRWVRESWRAPADPEVRKVLRGVSVAWREPPGVLGTRVETWVELLEGWLRGAET